MAADWASTAAIVSEIRMSAGHDNGVEGMSDARLVWAVTVNMGLTVVQIVGGILAGSLALVADALHNFSDAASLGLALFARKIGRRPADKLMTFGYGRAEVVAALINLTTLLIERKSPRLHSSH